MSVYRERMDRAESKNKTKRLRAEDDLRDQEAILRERDIARLLERLSPLEAKDGAEAAEALRAHLESTARDRGTSDAEILDLDERMDQLRRERDEGRVELQAQSSRYESQSRLRDAEIRWDEALEGKGLSHRLPRSRGSARGLVAATGAVIALELALLAPPLTSLVRDYAPTWDSILVGIAAATIVLVFVGAGAGAVIIAGRRYKEYLWAKKASEVSRELESAEDEPVSVPYENPELGTFLVALAIAIIIQAFLFLMRFISEDSTGDLAVLAVVVSGIATFLPIILFLMEKELHDPKQKGARAYDPEFLEHYDGLRTNVDNHIPRQLRTLKAQRDLRANKLLMLEIDEVRKHSLNIPITLVKAVNEMTAETEKLRDGIRANLEAGDE